MGGAGCHHRFGRKMLSHDSYRRNPSGATPGAASPGLRALGERVPFMKRMKMSEAIKQRHTAGLGRAVVRAEARLEVRLKPDPTKIAVPCVLLAVGVSLIAVGACSQKTAGAA